MTTADSVGSGTERVLQARNQAGTGEPVLFLVPALAAVATRRVTEGVETRERSGDDASGEQEMTQGFPETAGTVVLFDRDDPALLPNGMGQKYGLGFLRERAAEVGGSIAIHSAPGQGTRVVVDVPRRDHASSAG